MADCCKLVGDFPVGSAPGCIISVSTNSSTELNRICESFTAQGPTTGTLNMSAYASTTVHEGCPGRASVSIPWVRRYDCDSDQVHFIFSGKGRSSLSGDVDNLARIDEVINSYKIVNASAAGGPAALYSDEIQYDGYGLIYSGGPVSFSTNDDGQVSFTNWFGVGDGSELLLQSFNLTVEPGNYPVANYSFVFTA